MKLKQIVLFVLKYSLSLHRKPKKNKDMKQTLDTLKRIEQDAEAIGKALRNESQVYQTELEERQRLGLHGDAAIKHYNEWMQRNGMKHLMVRED